MINKLTSSIFFFFLCIAFFPIQAQIPTYDAILVNSAFTSGNQLEFDIYVKRTGSIPFEVYSFQHCFIFNNALLNGGIPTFTYIPGTSEMNPSQEPTNPTNLVIVSGGKRVIRMAGKIPSGPGNGTIISSTGNGTRFGRFKLTTSSTSFANYIEWDFAWNFNQAPYGYATKYQAYVGGLPTDITIQNYHRYGEGDCNYVPLPQYTAYLMNDTLLNPNTYEFDIYLKSTYLTFSLYGMSVCLLFDDAISAGGLLSSSYMAGTSELWSWQIPGNPDVSALISGKRVWKLTVPYTENGTIISNTGNGTKLGRFRILTSVTSFSNSQPNINWNFNYDTYGWATSVHYFYFNTRPWGGWCCWCYYDITNPSSHFNNLYNPVLPVELVSFKATATNYRTVLLEWSSATEANNYGFEIERKNLTQTLSKGEGFDAWENIGFVTGSGNSSIQKDYSYIDNSLNGGSKFAYRLKQMDNDGTFSYSSIQEVELELDEYVLSQNYPNPFNPTTAIEYIIPQAGQVTLSIYNLLGEKVDELVNEFKESGIYTIGIDASRLTSGTYIYSLRANGNLVSKKMIVLR